jgi:hypothetical protein
MTGRKADRKLIEERRKIYGGEPWVATSSLLKNKAIRRIVLAQSMEEYNHTWFESFVEYES